MSGYQIALLLHALGATISVGIWCWPSQFFPLRYAGARPHSSRTLKPIMKG